MDGVGQNGKTTRCEEKTSPGCKVGPWFKVGPEPSVTKWRYSGPCISGVITLVTSRGPGVITLITIVGAHLVGFYAVFF